MDMDRYSVQGKRVKRLREDAGLTQGEFVVRLKAVGATTTQSQLSQVERGAKGLSVEALAAVAMALDTSADYLLGLSDDATRREDQEEQVILVERDPSIRAWMQRLFNSLQRMPDAQREEFYKVLYVMYKGFGIGGGNNLES
jgi:transcriptional regulator with XRE-family HTH domain